MKKPKTLQEAIIFFSDLDVATQYVVNLRWPDGVTCPHCTGKEHSFISTRRIWKCKACKKQFSVKVGTVFEDSPIGLDKWLTAVWVIANAKNGVSSYELHRSIGVTQKTAWFMLHRIRLAMQSGTLDKLTGEVEADETYIGGKAKNMHPGKREVSGRGSVGKAIVFGLLERHGEARTKVVKKAKKKTLHNLIRDNVETGANLYTDAFKSYDGLDTEYIHQVIDHAMAYVVGNIHTNGMENFWSLFKRALRGTYVSCADTHLFRYLDEQTFRFNNRSMNDAGRFSAVMAMVSGKRIQYAQLIDNPTPKQLRLF